MFADILEPARHYAKWQQGINRKERSAKKRRLFSRFEKILGDIRRILA
jgi:hypothetical protein